MHLLALTYREKWEKMRREKEEQWRREPPNWREATSTLLSCLGEDHLIAAWWPSDCSLVVI